MQNTLLIVRNFLPVCLFLVFSNCQKTAGSNDKTTLLSEEVDAGLPGDTLTINCGQLRTQSPGGWGAPPAGNNPGVYLHANFAAACPNGLTVGCYPDNYNLTLTSAQAITSFLPAGGQPAAITTNYLDPESKQLKNSLANQIVTLTLNMVFDIYDNGFGQSDVNLRDMIIASGPFQQLTVADFLKEANKVLGGCSSRYTPQQVTETADSINQNFHDGTINNGFLFCPAIHD